VADILREETGAPADDPRPEVVAAALNAAHHSVFDIAEPRILAGESADTLLPALLAAIDRAYDVLATGLAEDPR
jgi:hypothetical protein